MASIKLVRSDSFCKLIIEPSIELSLECKILEKVYSKLASLETNSAFKLLRQFSGKTKHLFTKRPLWFVDEPVPLIGYNAFGIIDRGTNVIQVRPITGCNLNCIFCSVDEGPRSRTRINDFVVNPEHLTDWFARVASVKLHRLEAHIDGQGEPTLYPWFLELVQLLAEQEKVSLVSFQTNGTLLTPEFLDELASMPKKVRINLSLHTLDPRKAIMLSGASIELAEILEAIRYAAELKRQGKLDIILTPVYLPGLNDKDLGDVIVFAKREGIPVLIQKFEKHKLGRTPKLSKYQSWDEFFEWLMIMERKYQTKLIYRPGDALFEFHKDRRYPLKIKDRIAEIIYPGRTPGEYIGWLKNTEALVMIYSRYKLAVGEKVRLDKIHSKDSILYAYY